MKQVFDEAKIQEYADKLLIGLTPEENKMIREEFQIIDEDFSEMQSIEGLENVEPMSWCLDREITELRSDVVEESIPIEDALDNSDATSDREVEIVRVVGNEE